MKTVQQILSAKSANIFSVDKSASVFDALTLMMEKNISALIVTDQNGPTGIFTERDYARKIILLGKSSKETPVKEAMTSSLITVKPTDSIDLCMQLMTGKHIRHLPVMVDSQLIGMVSIGDVVKFIIDDQKQTINQLENYINS